VKRHIIVDTLGLLLDAPVSEASAHDGTHAPEVLVRLTTEHRARLELVWSDGKHRNSRLDAWLAETGAGYRVEVVERPPGAEGFLKLPRRRVVERTFAWLGRHRRHSRDYEYYAESSESMIRISSIHRMLKLLKPDRPRPAIPFKYRENHEIITG
jgi:putative transposase